VRFDKKKFTISGWYYERLYGLKYSAVYLPTSQARAANNAEATILITAIMGYSLLLDG